MAVDGYRLFPRLLRFTAPAPSASDNLEDTFGLHPTAVQTLPSNRVLIDHPAQAVFALTNLLGQKRQVRRYQRRFLIRHIGRVRFASRDYPATTDMTSIQVDNCLERAGAVATIPQPHFAEREIRRL
jgi:hypothetical protein